VEWIHLAKDTTKRRAVVNSTVGLLCCMELVGRLVGLLVNGLVLDWLVVWLVGWLVTGLVRDWLLAWLVVWLIGYWVCSRLVLPPLVC